MVCGKVLLLLYNKKTATEHNSQYICVQLELEGESTNLANINIRYLQASQGGEIMLQKSYLYL